jgi:hypothetical protein
VIGFGAGDVELHIEMHDGVEDGVATEQVFEDAVMFSARARNGDVLTAIGWEGGEGGRGGEGRGGGGGGEMNYAISQFRLNEHIDSVE